MLVSYSVGFCTVSSTYMLTRLSITSVDIDVLVA